MIVVFLAFRGMNLAKIFRKFHQDVTIRRLCAGNRLDFCEACQIIVLSCSSDQLYLRSSLNEGRKHQTMNLVLPLT